MKRKLALLFLAGAAGLFAQQSTRSAISDAQSATWTSATAQNASVNIATNGYTTALVTLNQTSTILYNGTAAFEGSDTQDASTTDNWFGMPCAAPTTNTSAYLLTASTKVAFQCNAVGFKRVRARLSNVFGGTGTVAVSVQLASSGAIPPSQIPASTTPIYTYNGDPCSDPAQTKTWTPFSQAGAGPATILTGVSAKKWYVCGILVTNGVSTGAINVNFVEGTGTNCSSVSAGLFGGTSAATGASVAASGGYAFGNGLGTVAVTATAADHVCYIASTTTQVSGVIVAVNK